MSSKENAIIELLSDDDDDEDNNDKDADYTPKVPPAQLTTRKPKAKAKKRRNNNNNNNNNNKPLQVGVVLEEDLHSTEPHDFLTTTSPPLLFHDPDFESAPSSIEGATRSKKDQSQKCDCKGPLKQLVQLRFITRGPNKGRPYHCCVNKGKDNGCNYFRWAFQAEKLHWYRLGDHTNHTLVNPVTGFSAQDLLQGKVGDCWFLSALAVIAERPDLIQRLFDCYDPKALSRGLVQVNLFLDGKWRTVTLDTFLPCIIDGKKEEELQQALDASMGMSATSTASTTATKKSNTSSKYDPFALSDKNRQVLKEFQTKLLDGDQQKKPAATTEDNPTGRIVNPYTQKKKPPASLRPPAEAIQVPDPLTRPATTQDLAYSKAKNQQLWVPFLEKAYAKSHGCYQAISGGHIAEAFLDLTGAPTLQHSLHNQPNFDPKYFWSRLLRWRQQRLPMGCATSQSQVGIIGMHAYSILDIVEINNVHWEFFRDKLQDRTLGNVSGFTELDGTVRLLRIRNPHGKGEWKGEFSDQSDMWEKLLIHSGTTLERTFQNDGTFWIDYDSFLLGFSNVDVVLAFPGNHARSFETNFPLKQSNQRCTRAFEVCLVDDDSSGCYDTRDTVELYCLGIQKTRRGAYHGRSDRKVSYKICDVGMLIGEPKENDEEDDDAHEQEFTSVQGEMFGFKRNGHSRLVLDRQKNKRLIVMPISFGHPAATDKDRSFVLRFVADAPLVIRELPEVPRMDRVLHTYCFESQPAFNEGQRKRKVLLEGPSKGGEPLYRVFQIDCLAEEGGVVLVYLCLNDRLRQRRGMENFMLHLSMEATCRGMMCRTETGFLAHETLAKGKKFQAAWRKFTTEFHYEDQSRLLMVLVQAGQDSEMGSVNVRELKGPAAPKKVGQTTISAKGEVVHKPVGRLVDDEKLGIFNGDCDRLRDDQRTSIFGPNPTGGARRSGLAGHGGIDHELAEALARSRGDIEMKAALELSRGRHSEHVESMSDNQAMQLALERSRNDMSAVTMADSGFEPSEGKAVASVSDSDLKEAIKRSLEVNKIAGRAQNGMAAHDDGVVDLVDTEDVENEQPKPPKRKKMEKDVIEIVDIDDDGDTEEMQDKKDDSLDNPTTVKTPEDKRKIAAEAAERRFKSITSNP